MKSLGDDLKRLKGHKPPLQTVGGRFHREQGDDDSAHIQCFLRPTAKGQCFWCDSQPPWLAQGQGEFLLFSSQFYNFQFYICFYDPFWVVYVCMTEFIFKILISNCSSTICGKIFFLYWTVFPLLWKISYLHTCGSILGVSIFSLWICLSIFMTILYCFDY